MVTVLLLDVLKAVSVLMLARIGVTDFLTQQIRNEHMRQLFAVALAILVLSFVVSGDSMAVWLTVASSAALFILLLIFWLLGKLGAGDVKLMATIPLLVGMPGSVPFVVALLVFTFLTYGVSKFPNLLPERWFRAYIQNLAKSGRVPFGVPIAAAAIVAMLAAPIYAAWQAPPQNAALLKACAPADPGKGDSGQFPAALQKAFC